MSNGTDIAAEIHAALIEAATATGSGVLTAPLWRKVKPAATGNAWTDANATPTPTVIGTLTILDTGSATRYDRNTEGALVPRNVRTLMVSAGVPVLMGDQVELSDGKHEITKVSATAPGGEVLFYELDLAI